MNNKEIYSNPGHTGAFDLRQGKMIGSGGTINEQRTNVGTASISGNDVSQSLLGLATPRHHPVSLLTNNENVESLSPQKNQGRPSKMSKSKRQRRRHSRQSKQVNRSDEQLQETATADPIINDMALEDSKPAATADAIINDSVVSKKRKVSLSPSAKEQTMASGIPSPAKSVAPEATDFMSDATIASVALQGRVRAMAKQMNLHQALYFFLPDVVDLYNNASGCGSKFDSYMQALDRFHKRILKYPAMLNKLKRDYDTMDIQAEMDKIFGAGILSAEAIQIRDSYRRTMHIAANVLLLERCVSEGKFNYDMKYSKNEKNQVINDEMKRSLTDHRRNGTPAFLPDEEVPVGGEIDEEECESSVGVQSLSCDGINRRRFKSSDIHVSNVSGTQKLPGQLSIEEHEMSGGKTQRGALAVELLNTGGSRMYDLPESYHNFNRSYYAPINDKIDSGDTNVSSHHCGKILVSSDLVRSGGMGINADYSLELIQNSFITAKVYKSVVRQSGASWTHDAQWLRLEACFALCRELQGVDENCDFIPDLDKLRSLDGVEGMTGKLACEHWRTITGEITGAKYTTNLCDWKIISLKKLGIHFDQESYKAKVQQDIERRRTATKENNKQKIKSAMMKRLKKG